MAMMRIVAIVVGVGMIVGIWQRYDWVMARIQPDQELTARDLGLKTPAPAALVTTPPPPPAAPPAVALTDPRPQNEETILLVLPFSRAATSQAARGQFTQVEQGLAWSLRRSGAGWIANREIGDSEARIELRGSSADVLLAEVRRTLFATTVGRGAYVLRRSATPGAPDTRVAVP